MNTLTVNLSASAPTADFTYKTGPFVLKGPTMVSFNFDNVNEVSIPIITLEADFGDSTEDFRSIPLGSFTAETNNAVQIAITGKINSISLPDLTHTYSVTESDVERLTATFLCTYSSFHVGSFYAEFILLKDSYYGLLDEINISSTQLLPVSANDIYMTMSSKDGIAYSVRLVK